MKLKKILHLTLKKKWFDMILCGEKKEEYRELKTHWCRRLLCDKSMKISDYPKFYQIERIVFRNGYAKNAPEIVVECDGIVIREGREEWGAIKGELYFVIRLGKIISTSL